MSLRFSEGFRSGQFASVTMVIKIGIGMFDQSMLENEIIIVVWIL